LHQRFVSGKIGHRREELEMKSADKRGRASRKKQITGSHIIVVVIAAFLMAGLLILLDSDILRQDNVMAAEHNYEVGITADGDPYKGSPDAPLQMVLYSDFLCGHCHGLAMTLDEISSEYVETGKLQIVFKNYAFMTPESILAAEASECALEQGADAFWRYHDLLYASQGGGLAAYTPSALKEYAAEIGLDTKAFEQCLDNGNKSAVVEADVNAGVSAGVQGTPTWFINGQMVPGAVPADDFRSILNQLLRISD
jgi:protein-disulfide isomerase